MIVGTVARKIPMIEIQWGGKLYQFASEKEARAAGFHLDPVKPVEVKPESEPEGCKPI